MEELKIKKTMDKIRILFLLVFLTSIQVVAKAQFKDMVVADKFIVGLTNYGQLKLFDKSNGEKIEKRITNTSEILLLTVDKFGNIIIADKGNNIKRYNSQISSWVVISTYNENASGILFDSKNRCYLITDKGIRDVQTHKLYYSRNSLNHQITYKDKWGKPYCFYIDKKDRIWLGFGYGEWGGNLFIFDTANKSFITPTLDKFKIDLWPIKSFFEDSNSVYLSSGLQHMFTSGIIVRFDSLTATTLLLSEHNRSKSSGNFNMKAMNDPEYIGPATYSSIDNSIYYYSQNGIFSGDRTKDLSKIENWKLVVKPTLHWKSGQPDAVGSPMNVLKIIILDKGKFVFLSQEDGIGFFDKDKLIMVRL